MKRLDRAHAARRAALRAAGEPAPAARVRRRLPRRRVRAHARRRPPRSQAGEHHARRLRRGLRARLGRRARARRRRGRGGHRGSRQSRSAPASRASSSARRATWRPSSSRAPSRSAARRRLRARLDPVRDPDPAAAASAPSQAAIASTLDRDDRGLTGDAVPAISRSRPSSISSAHRGPRDGRPRAPERARRSPSAIQAYLDGDRDLARRKRWRASSYSALAPRSVKVIARRRCTAAGRALALDPELGGAAELITSLVLEPPKDPPPQLVAALREADLDGVRKHARTAILAYLAIASFLPIAAWNGIRKWPEVLAVFACALLLAGAAWAIRRNPQRTFAEMVALRDRQRRAARDDGADGGTVHVRPGLDLRGDDVLRWRIRRSSSARGC